VYGSSAFTNTRYANAIEDGVDLSQSLNKDRAEYQAGFKTDLTPLLSVQLYGSYTDDEFKYEPLRNTTSSAANATFRIAADAVVTGMITVGYKDQQPVDPLANEFRGFTGNAAIVYPLLEYGRFFVTANRGTEYSFDAREAYAWGFLQKLVPAVELDSAVEKWIDSILASGARAVRLQKALMRDWERMPLSDSIRRGIEACVEARRTDEPRKMMAAFLERKKRS